MGFSDPSAPVRPRSVICNVDVALPATGTSHHLSPNPATREPDLTGGGLRPMRRSSYVNQPHFGLQRQLEPAQCFSNVSGWGLKFYGNSSVTNFIELVEGLLCV